MPTRADPALTALDPRHWTVSEAQCVLAPHLTARQVRALIRAASLPVTGRRHSSSLRGKPAETYSAPALIELLGALDVLVTEN